MKRMLTFISIHSFYLKLRKFLRFKWLRKLFVVFSTRFDTNHISFSRIAEKLPFHVAEPCVSFPSRQLEPSTRRSGISASRPGWIGSACGKWPVQIKQTECHRLVLSLTFKQSQSGYLDLAHFDEPVLDILGSGNQNAMAMVLRLTKDRVEVFDARHNADGHLSPLGRRLWTRV